MTESHKLKGLGESTQMSIRCLDLLHCIKSLEVFLALQSLHSYSGFIHFLSIISVEVNALYNLISCLLFVRYFLKIDHILEYELNEEN